MAAAAAKRHRRNVSKSVAASANGGAQWRKQRSNLVMRRNHRAGSGSARYQWRSAAACRGARGEIIRKTKRNHSSARWLAAAVIHLVPVPCPTGTGALPTCYRACCGAAAFAARGGFGFCGKTRSAGNALAYALPRHHARFTNASPTPANALCSFYLRFFVPCGVWVLAVVLYAALPFFAIPGLCRRYVLRAVY